MNNLSKLKQNRLKIAVIGSRGIPPRYGGAETFVYELSKRLKKYYDIYVSCESDKFKIDEYLGVKRVHIWAVHGSTVTVPSLWDIVATIYLLIREKRVKVIYYVAPDGALAALIAKLAGKKVVINVNGLEWKRILKRIFFVPFSLKLIYIVAALYLIIMEFLACRISDVTIADSITVKKYIERRWKAKKVRYIAYGIRELPKIGNKQQKILNELNLEPNGYYLTIGRIVAENNIEVEIEAFKKANTRKKLVIVGFDNLKDPYVKYLYKLKNNNKNIIFIKKIYDLEKVYALRNNCYAYIHTYSVGGTNPSLIEQLQFNKPILANDVLFHREVLEDEAIYFKSSEQLSQIITQMENGEIKEVYRKPKKRYTWTFVTQSYRQLFDTLVTN